MMSTSSPPPAGPQLPSPWRAVRSPLPPPQNMLPPLEHETPPRRSGPHWLKRLGKWLFYRDVPERPQRRLYELNAGPLLTCPQCETRQGLEQATCAHCGFPFICAIDAGFEEVRQQARARRAERWRLILAAVTLTFIVTNGLLLAGSNAAYEGTTSHVISRLRRDTENQVPISGPASFVGRTELALGLLKERVPDYYYRIQKEVRSIEYQAGHELQSEDGRSLSLEGIGALAITNERRVLVLPDTAFNSGIDELVDRDVFVYAGTLVHELRHIELHAAGIAPGGVEEEVLCEQGAYDALTHANAPRSVLARYELYFSDPNARRYQRWYDFYKQE